MVPRVPLATPSWAMALRPQTTRSPTASCAVLDLEAVGAEAAPGGQQLLAGLLSRSTSLRVGQQGDVLAGLCSACCQAAHQSWSRARVAAGLLSAATTRSWAR